MVWLRNGLSVIEDYGLTVSYHAPYRDFNLASINERIRCACVHHVIEMGESIQNYGGWVNIHPGHVLDNYPEKVLQKA